MSPLAPARAGLHLGALFAALLAAATPAPVGAQTAAEEPPLTEARAGFSTEWRAPQDYAADGPPPTPPAEAFRLVRYPSPAGELAAYLTPDPGDGVRRPAVIWAHGGFGGIGRWLWGPGSGAAAFRAAGFVVLCPSWRGEADNPGRFELFFGEVDDALAAVEYVAALPYVDPQRIYMAGHSTGGTVTLLTALASGRLRAAFSFGGCPDLERLMADGGYGNTPYDPGRVRETELRSPIRFVRHLRTPTYYFEGEDSAYPADAERMQAAARDALVPFTAFTLKGGDHFDVLGPLTRLVADELRRDVGPEPRLALTANKVQGAFDRDLEERLSRALERDGSDPDLLLRRAVVRRRLLQPRDAARDLMVVTRQRPGDVEAWFELAMALEELRRLKDAVACYDRILKDHPDDLPSLYNRAVLQEELGRLGSAARDAQRVVELNPSDAEARAMLTRIRARQGSPACLLLGCAGPIALFAAFVLWLRLRSRSAAAQTLRRRR